MISQLIIPEGQVPVIIADVPVTLRKRMSFVLAQPGKFEFAGQSLEDALKFLIDNDFHSVDLISGTGYWTLDFDHILTEEEVSLWLEQLPPC